MKYKVNISVDDVSPHPQSSVKVIDRCFKLIEEFKDIKFTLFVPIAYWRTFGSTASQRPYYIYEYPDFCEYLKSLPKKNFEIGYHGWYHGIPGVSNNDEFKNIDFLNADLLFQKMFHIVEHVGLKEIFKPIFRPPAWKMSREAFKAAKKNGIKVLALSSKIDYEEEYDKIVYYNCIPPFEPLKHYPKNEIVYHACEWDKNYLTEEKTKKLSDFLKSENVEFCFIENIV